MRRWAILFLTCTLLFNNFSTLGAMDMEGSSSDMLSQVLCAESSLLSMLTLSSLPIDIVSRMVREDGALCEVFRNGASPTKKKGEKRSRNIPPEGILLPDAGSVIAKNIARFSVGAVLLLQGVPIMDSAVQNNRQARGMPPVLLCWCLLFYFIVLAKSNLPAYIVCKRYNQLEKPERSISGFLF